MTGTCTFALEWRDRRLGPSQTPRRFLDFIIDGESLYERHGADYISCLGWFVPAQDELAAARLLRDEPPDVEDRVSICVCPECGDLYCGVITARIVREDKAIAWKDIAMSTFDFDADVWRHGETDFADLPALRFDAREYWEAIHGRPRPAGG